MPKFDTPITANSASIDRLLKAGLPVLLLLHKGTLPANIESNLKAIAKAEAGALLVAKADTNDDSALKSRFSASAGLTLVAIQNGEEITRYDNPTADTLTAYADYLTGRRANLPQMQKSVPKTAKPIQVTDSSFKNDVLNSDKPVLVDFWAAWCGPCQMIAPSLEKLAGEFAGDVTIAKLNVDENPQTAGAYRVQGIPMLLMFKNGKAIDKLVGAAPEPMLRQFIQKHAG